MSRTRVTLLALIPFVFASCSKLGKPGAPKTDLEKISYVIGQQIGNGLKSQNLKVDVKFLAQSIEDAMNGVPSQLTQQQMQEVMMAMQKDRMGKQEEEAKANKLKEDKYLAENKGKPGVVTTKTGLQYQVLTEGKGASPKASDVVNVHYKGTLIDGSEFDSSYKRGQPAEFPVGAVIPGWTEALQLMKVGSKWKLVIPSQLAYGSQFKPGIPPNSLLIFEVELLSIGGAKKAAVAPTPKKKK